MFILGIDPGSNHAGLAAIEIDDTCQIKSITTHHIDVSKDNASNLYTAPIVARLHRLEVMVEHFIDRYQPFCVASEHPFINVRRPGSVIPIARALSLIENTVYKYDKHILQFPMRPGEVKKAVNAKNFKGKEPMLDAVSAIQEITEHIDVSEITDHEVDAIALAYGFLNHLREHPEILIR